MSDPYERAIGGRLVYKGGALAALNKTIDKKKKKKHKKDKNHQNPNPNPNEEESDQILNDEELQRLQESQSDADRAAGGEDAVYTIDAAKKMKYDELFPVEAKKFGYDPKTKARSVEDALDDRVKKKADRYCK
ncbi:hypothetical protein Syun_022457 [Stephania yunnanensis]|uniref:Uncharacterized protein n=1 Tax=Stephania yunnanensis TaxID=152371 RepID=A0AAP0F718_9MAGN